MLKLKHCSQFHDSVICLSLIVLFLLLLLGYETADLPGGASFKLNYSPDAKDEFFSDVLPVPENQQSCPVNSFIKFNTTGDLSWMSFTTECPKLSILDFSFAPGSLQHQVYLTGSSDPPTPNDRWAGATVKVYSWLVSSPLQLNQYLSILQPSSGAALSAGYWSGGREEGRIYNAAFSLLDTYFTAPADINDGSLHFTAWADIFGSYRCLLSGVVPSNSQWENATITVAGIFESGNSSFLQRLQGYIQTYATNRIAQAEERLNRSLQANIAAQERVASFQPIYNESLLALQAAQLEHQLALQRVTAATTAVDAAQTAVNANNAQENDLQADVIPVCDIENCTLTCVPGVECQVCDNQLAYEDWDYCNWVRTEDKLMYRTVTRVNIRHTFMRQCRRLTLIRGWGLTEFAQTCPYISVTEEFTSEERESYYDSANVSHISSCSNNIGSYSAKQCCCQSYPCRLSLPNPQCLYRNAACLQVRKRIHDDRDNLHTLLALNEAQESLTTRREELALAEFVLSITRKEYETAQSTYLALLQAAAASNASFHQVLAMEQTFLQLKTLVSTVPIQQLAQIQGINFAITFQQASPTIIPLAVNVSIPLLSTSITQTIPIDLTAPEELVMRDIATVLLNTIPINIINSGLGRRRRAVELPPPNVRRFERNCATIANLKQHLFQLNTSLDDAWEHSYTTKANITSIDGNLTSLMTTSLGNLSSINFTHLLANFTILVDVSESVIGELARNSSSVAGYFKALSTISTLMQTLHSSLDSTLFISWQTAIGNVSSISGTNCYSLVDCLTNIGNIVQELLEDTPGNGADTFLALLPAAKQTLAELALRSNLTLAEAKSRTAPMWSLVRWLENNGYWCSTPPTITEQPQQKVNVNLGQEFSISCLANSTLPLSYSWRRSHFLLPNYSNNTLMKSEAEWSDGGLYQCLAKNAISTTESLFSTVRVFQTPTITLSPSDFTTYEGDDNGAVFVCNATGKPDPNYRWYWTRNGSTWYPVSDSSTNELVLTKPRKEQEGWYRCRAFTDNGYTNSEPARLTILSVSISKLAYPIWFQLQAIGTVDESGAGSGNGPNILERARQLLISTISQHINLQAAQIENIRFMLSPNQTAIISFIVSNVRNFPFVDPLAEDALVSRESHENVTIILAQLEQLLASGVLRIEFGGYVFSIVNNSVRVSNLEFLCPPGHSLQYSSYLCGKHFTLITDRQKFCSCLLPLQWIRIVLDRQTD